METFTKSELKYVNGRGFPLAFTLMFLSLGYVGVLVWREAIGLQTILSTPLFVLSLMPLTCSWGTELDLKRRLVREYNSIYWMQSGCWRSFKGFDHIVISEGNLGTSWWKKLLRKSKPSVYLMTPDHRHRILISINKDKTEAIRMAKDLAKYTGCEIHEFNPKLTKSKRL